MSPNRVPPPFPQPFGPTGTANPPPYEAGTPGQSSTGPGQGTGYPPESTFAQNMHSRHSRLTPPVSSLCPQRYSECRATPDTSAAVISIWTSSRVPTIPRFSSNPSSISDASSTTPLCAHYVRSAAAATAAATTANGTVGRDYAHAYYQSSSQYPGCTWASFEPTPTSTAHDVTLAITTRRNVGGSSCLSPCPNNSCVYSHFLLCT
jgi:hypothetical protein